MEEMTLDLRRNKRVYDAVHGFIHFNALEREVIHSEPFQRLHALHQLGIAYFVYPGATHTRFEHSLGTMALATQIVEGLTKKGFSYENSEYWLQIIRLAALCHDLGHLPFSHSAEAEILGKGGHERWTVKAIQSEELSAIWALVGPTAQEDIIKMAVGQEKLLEIGMDLPFSPIEKVLSQVITGDFFGADRIDYLLRDAKCTGVSYGLFDHHQMMEMLTVVDKEELTLGIEEDGIASCEALLLARHFMHQRVYQYSSVKAYKFHLVRFLKAFYAAGDYLSSLDRYLSVSDHEIMASLRVAAKDPEHLGHEDAKALLRRENRFRAVCVVEEAPDKGQEGTGLHFPVLLRSGAIVPASEVSSLSIPQKQTRWLYVAPEQEKRNSCSSS